TDNYNSWYIRPGYFPIQKNRLVDMTIDSYNNYYSYYIDSLIEKIQRGISETFFYARKEKYLFKPNDVIKAIDKISANKDDFIIIDFRHNVQSANQSEGIDLQRTDYTVHNFDKFNDQLVGGSIFIVKRSDLPNFHLVDIDEKTINKFKLQNSLDSEGKLFASILDFNNRNSKSLLE